MGMEYGADQEVTPKQKPKGPLALAAQKTLPANRYKSVRP